MASLARIKKAGKEYEVIIDDVEKALELKDKLKKGDVDQNYFLETIKKICPTNFIFFDEKKGLKPSQAELQEAFGTTDFFEIVKEILRDGEITLPAEIRKKFREQKLSQIIDFISRNAIDPRTKTLHPVERIKAAIKQAGVKVDEFKSIDVQIPDIINQLSKIIPIKIEIRRIEVIVPAAFTGKAYSLFTKFNKQKEEWQDDGSLRVILTLPSALIPEFFDKLNKATQGTALTKDLGEV